jgi:hypothetical protein
MSAPTITWIDSIDSPWLSMTPSRIGDIPAGLGTPSKFILVELAGRPALRVDAYPSSEECFVFNDAMLWHSFLVVGWGDCAYLIGIESGAVTKHRLGAYFGHFYVNDDSLLIASCDRLWRIDTDGSVQWKSDTLGIDGVLVSDVDDGVISGQGEWDPPGGWQPFRIMLESGQDAK